MTGISYLSPVKNVLCEEDNNLDIMESHKLAVDTEAKDLCNENVLCEDINLESIIKTHKLAVDTDTETENLYNTYLCFIFIFYIVILCF